MLSEGPHAAAKLQLVKCSAVGSPTTLRIATRHTIKRPGPGATQVRSPELRNSSQDRLLRRDPRALKVVATYRAVVAKSRQMPSRSPTTDVASAQAALHRRVRSCLRLVFFRKPRGAACTSHSATGTSGGAVGYVRQDKSVPDSVSPTKRTTYVFELQHPSSPEAKSFVGPMFGRSVQVRRLFIVRFCSNN